MKKILLITTLILLAAAAVMNAARVHHKVYDKCTREWLRQSKEEKLVDGLPAGYTWQEMPVSRFIRLTL